MYPFFMKHIFTLFLVFFFAHNAAGQTASVTNGCAPLTVAFTSPSSSTYFWNFNDGATSSLPNPSNTFLTPNTYVVEFRTTQNGPIVGTVTINVEAKPVPIFTSDASSGCAPISIQFTDATVLPPSVQVNSYSWVFGDGGSAIGSSTTHVFNASGNFFVSLELNTSSPSCNVTKQYDNFISASTPPTVGFTTNPDPPVACISPLNISFNNTSSSNFGNLTYKWDLGNTQTSTATNPPNQTYTIDQNYVVALVATDTNNCANSTSKTISVGSPTVDLVFPDTICLNLADTIFNNSTGTPTWNFGPDATVLDFAEGVHPVIIYNTGGMKTISLQLRTGTCTTDTTINIFVDEIVADFTSSPTYTCAYPSAVNFSSNSNQAVSYLWTHGNDSTSITQNTLVSYQNPRTNIYDRNIQDFFTTKLVVMNAFGCRDSLVKTDTVHSPNALMMPSVTKGCVPLTVVFSDSSTVNTKDVLTNWEWFYGDGNSSNAVNNSPASYTYSTTGEFLAFLVVTNSSGCTDTSYQTKIKVGEQITPNFTADNLTVCLGDTVNFSDQTNSPIKDSIDAWNYSSESDRLFNCFQQANTSWVYNNEVGPQSVTMTVGFNGCYTSFTRQNYITVQGAVAKIDYLKDCDQDFLVQYRDSSLNSNATQWKFGDGVIDNTNYPNHTYAATGDYSVILRAEDVSSGCAATFDTVQINIRNLQAKISLDTLLCVDVDVNLSADSTTGAFENCYNGYRWLFTDSLMRPVTTAFSNEIVQFKTTGSTDVQLIATDINGCKDTASQNVQVYGVQTNFGISDALICNPTLVNFTDSSSGDTTLVSWFWDFGDLTTSSDTNTSNTYTSFARNLVPFLTVTDILGCTSTLRKNITMYQPLSIVTVDDSTICLGTTVNFSATDYTLRGSSLTFNWDFKDGDSNKIQNPSNTFTTEGDFLVELDVEEIATGCQNQTTVNISVLDYPDAGFTTTSDTLKYICPNENILFTDTTYSSYLGNLQYQWDFDNGRTSSFKNPGTVFISNGTYTVQQTVTVPPPYNCASTYTRSIIVKGPEGNFFTNLEGSPICRSESVLFTLKDTADVEKYMWDFGDGTSLENVSPINHQYNFVPNSGQTVAKLILSNSDGSCAITRDTIIDIHEVRALFQRNNGIDTAICLAPYPLSNLSVNADSWSWDFGNGTSSTQEEPGIISFDSSGTYPIQLSVKNNALGCTDTLIKDIILFSSPKYSIIGDTICEGELATIQIDSTNALWSYSWTSFPKVSTSDTTLASITSQPFTSTKYFITVNNINGCFKIDSASILVINDLNLTDFDTTIVIGDVIDLPVYVDAGLYNFTWTETDGLSCLDCSPPRIQPLEKISYNLILSDILGCFTYDVDFNIDIHPETFVKIPTTFSPNNDGTNDVIYLKGWGIKELVVFQIFNRFGEIVFETNDIAVGWDGTYRGEIQNNDVYVYKVKVKTWRNEEKAMEGYINLIQ